MNKVLVPHKFEVALVLRGAGSHLGCHRCDFIRCDLIGGTLRDEAEELSHVE